MFRTRCSTTPAFRQNYNVKKSKIVPEAEVPQIVSMDINSTINSTSHLESEGSYCKLTKYLHSVISAFRFSYFPYRIPLIRIWIYNVRNRVINKIWEIIIIRLFVSYCLLLRIRGLDLDSCYGRGRTRTSYWNTIQNGENKHRRYPYNRPQKSCNSSRHECNFNRDKLVTVSKQPRLVLGLPGRPWFL